ncbi:MAG: metal ABC transporter ATP-binding protein [Rhodobacteraceae bacterium]|nr:metal ABC transporter ATP-binding protein [Paracoccaceae bacterium]
MPALQLSADDLCLVRVENLHIQIGRSSLLEGIDFTIAPGEIITVIGPNGAGKSTLVKAIIGSLPPSEGFVRKRKGLRIGYVPQRMHVDASLPITVMRFMGLPISQSKDAIKRALAQTRVDDCMHRQLSELSSGQLQRVLVARALLVEPDLLILDEATAGLDQPAASRFFLQIEAIHQQINCAIMMVSHELNMIMATSRILCLKHHLCCQGTPEEVARTHEYHTLFGDTVLQYLPGIAASPAQFDHHEPGNDCAA